MNWKKILTVNFILIVFVLLIIELGNYQKYKNKYYRLIEYQMKKTDSVKANKEAEPVLNYKKSVWYNYRNHRDKDRFVIFGKSNKLPIITIGCSYNYGLFLKDKYDTFAGQLNKVTGRTIYNLGLPSTGPQIVYEQLSSPLMKEEIPEAEYVVYVFIYCHLWRQFESIISPVMGYVNPIYYIDKKGQLKKKKRLPLFLHSSFTIRNYLENIIYREYKKEMDNDFPLFLKTMDESVKAMKKNYPNAKFVFIEFPQAHMSEDKSTELTEKNIKDIEKLGIIYINAEQLVGHKYRDVKKYRVADQDHPNEIVWKEMAPALKNKLNL